MTLQLELNEKLENELKKISEKNNCTIQQYLENGFNEYIEQMLDRQLIEKTEAYEDENGMNYYKVDEALDIMNKIDSGNISDEDIDNI